MKTLVTTPFTIHEPIPTINQSNLVQTRDGKYRIPKAVCKETLYQLVIQLYEVDFKRETQFSNPDHAKKYLHLKLAHLDYETFNIIYLDNQHQLMTIEELTTGSIDSASVYPREVVKRAIQTKCAAVMFCHNHPSGIPEPSNSDRALTKQLKDALSLIDIRVLDHIIIGGSQVTSFAERGLI